MKILFIRPPQNTRALFHIMPPLGLGYLISAVKKRNLDVEVEFIDCLLRNLSCQRLISEIKNSRPDVICFSVYTHDLNSVKAVSSLIKKQISERIVIIVGGPHPSAAPQHTLNFLADVDFAFKGEAEIGLPSLIEYLQNKSGTSPFEWNIQLEQIPGLIGRGKKPDIRVNKQTFTEDLDSLGFPDWKLLIPHNYLKTCHGVFFKKDLFAPIFATRGCPQFCGFCAAHNVMGRKVRKRSIAHIIGEILYLKHYFKIKEFHFLDDNFTADKEFVTAFCKEILTRNIRILWCCPNGIRVDTVDEEMLDIMKESGCYSIFLGIESGSQRVLDRMNKRLKLYQIESKVKLIKSKGFEMTGFFIMGYPGETREEMRKTINFAKNLPIDCADISNFLPLPGTTAFKSLFKNNEIDNLNFRRLSSPSHVGNVSAITPFIRIQKAMIRRAYIEFYLRPRILFRILLKIKNKYQFYFLIKRVFAYLFFQ